MKKPYKPCYPKKMIPRVRLKISEDAEGFLKRMDSVLRRKDSITVKSKLECQGEHDHLSVGFSPNVHDIDELVGMFVYWPDEFPVLRIEATARWKTALPTYEGYVGAIKDLFVEPIGTYNRENGRRYRLRIPSKQSCLPRLTPKLAEVFDHFVALANKRCLHPHDWHRFYRFVVVSYRSQPSLTESDVRYHLRKAGFEAEQISYIADAFARCKDFYIETDTSRSRAYRKQG